MKTLRETLDQLDEISRRGFLQGAAALGASDAASRSLEIERYTTSSDGNVSLLFVSEPGRRGMGWLALKKQNGIWNAQNNKPRGRILLDRKDAINVGFVFLNDMSIAHIEGVDYIRPLMSASQLVIDLKQIGGNLVEFRPSRGEPVEESSPDALAKIDNLFRK